MLDEAKNMDGLLMLHLAGELPADQSAKLAKQLASDPALQQSLGQLRHLNEGLTLVIKESDDLAIAALTKDSRREATVRQISRAMVRQQLQEQAADAAPGHGIKRLRLRTWSFSAAAALAIVGFGVIFLASLNPSSKAPQAHLNESDALASGEVSAPLMDIVSPGDQDILSISQGSYDVSSFATQTQND